MRGKQKMKCRHCNDTGKYKQPNDPQKFEEIIDREMEKAYMVNYEIAENLAYQKVGFTVIDCPYCSKSN